MEGSEIVHTYTPNGANEFVMVVAKEGVRTVDGREFAAGAIEWRELPIPLLSIRGNDPTGRGGHKSSRAIGSIAEIWREDDENGNGTIYGRGYFASDEEGMEAKQLIAEGVLSGVSADVGGAVVEELVADEEFGTVKMIHSGTIVGVTVLPIPAFDGTKVSVVHKDELAEAVVASAGAWQPKSEWFSDPKFTEPTPITVTADGRIQGHAALWGTCHVGYRDRCVTPPRSKSHYQYFNTGQVLTADGETVNVGRLTAGTGHAAIDFGAQTAVDHYDNTGYQGGYVHAGEDEHGIWFSGTVSPTATPEQIATLRASMVSGDWRKIGQGLELVGILAVNTPGFPVPRARAGLVAGAQVSLIASGLCGCENDDVELEAITDEVVAVEQEIETPEVDDTVVDLEADSDAAISADLFDAEFDLKLRLLDLAMWETTGLDFSKKGKAKPCCAECAEKASHNEEVETA